MDSLYARIDHILNVDFQTDSDQRDQQIYGINRASEITRLKTHLQGRGDFMDANLTLNVSPAGAGMYLVTLCSTL